MTSLVLLVLLGGCGSSIQPLYDAARDAALVDPGPPPASWTPDAVVQLSGPVVEDVLQAATRGRGPLSTTLALGPAQVVPEVRLKSLRVVPSRPCEGGCVGLDAVFDGSIAWTAGPLKGTTPFSAHGALDAVFALTEDGDAFVVTAVPRKLRDLEIEIADLDATIKGLKRSIRTLIETEALSRVPPQTLIRFPRSDLPIRAGRIASEGTGARLELLTDVPVPGTATAGAAPTEGFVLSLAEGTLLGLARAEAFRHGPVAYGVVPEPTALRFTDDGFTLGLRLWRLEGVGWWRDYTITGTAEIRGGRLRLAPTDVVEGEKSKGATLADPLAALAEGLILKAIEDAVNTSLPLAGEPSIGKQAAAVTLERLEPAAGTVRGTGAVRLGGR